MTIQKRTHTIVRQRSPSKRHEALSFRPRLWTLIYVVSGVARFPAESCAAELTRWAAMRLSEAKAHMLHIAREGVRDLYISGYVWHAPDGFTREDRGRLNAYAYGAGFGKRRIDANGRESLIYALVFSDSHYDPQPIAG